MSEKYTHKWSIKLRQFLSQMRKTNSTKLIDCIIKFLYFWEVISHAWLNFSTRGNEWIIWPSGHWELLVSSWLRELCSDYWFEKQKLHNRFVRHFTAFRNVYVTSKSYSKMRLNCEDLRLKAWKINRITPNMHTCYWSTVKIKIRN